MAQEQEGINLENALFNAADVLRSKWTLMNTKIIY